MTPRPNDSQSHWRGWAILLELVRLDEGAGLSTPRLLHRIQGRGWYVYGQMNRTTGTRRACEKLERDHLLKREQHLTSEIVWKLTQAGRDFAERHLIDSPHVTPAKSEERFK
jgi:hypothetical protein